MAAKSKLTYKIYVRGSGQWHWEVATAESQIAARVHHAARRRGGGGVAARGAGAAADDAGDWFPT
jgi:hypothetical protein